MFVQIYQPVFKKQYFVTLLKFVTSDKFRYEDKLREQFDEDAMGSYLGHTLKNAFLTLYSLKLGDQHTPLFGTCVTLISYSVLFI